MSFQIAIDGPAGAGKSTIARQVAREKGYIYIDTGAMYRAMALFFIRHGITAAEQERMKILCREADIRISYREGRQIVTLNGEEVNHLLRTGEVSAMASVSSQIKEVRDMLVTLQRQLAREENVVMDGRDIGTCVLPGADLKIYLTADIHTRAMRRAKEMEAKGVPADLYEIEKEIEERDRRDMSRENSPLKQAEDAVLVDTSNMLPGEVAAEILGLIDERYGRKG